MKLVFRTVALLLTVPFFLFACSNTNTIGPSETIIKFDETAKKGNIKESKQYIESETIKSIESGKAWWIGTYSSFIADYNKTYKKVVPLKKTEKINGDTASVKVEVTHPDNSKEERTYNLVKEDHRWKITMNQ
ncbi:MAG: hypothetical protein K0Q87_5398 [Neobacillus sp.]|jgi:hypothetical protein|nr:hypothetical protein [Neobacillus sp.]